MIENLLNPAFIDPNIVYVGILLGLWLSITALYMPGTGLPEIGALLVLGASLLALSVLPTNWLAVVVFVAGAVGFLTLPFIPKIGQFAELGLLMQAGAGFFLFTDARTVSPVLIVATVALAWGYHRAILMPMLRRQREESFSDATSNVIGVVGRVVKPLTPVGTINANGELWTARAQYDDEQLDTGTSVIVLAQRGLELLVEKAKRDEVQ